MYWSHYATGGLEENVDEAIVHAAFIPFGDIKDVNIPLDQVQTAIPTVCPAVQILMNLCFHFYHALTILKAEPDKPKTFSSQLESIEGC